MRFYGVVKVPQQEPFDSNIEPNKSLYANLVMVIKVKYYNMDAYENVEGIVSSFDDVFRTLTIVKKSISFDDILDVSGINIQDYE